MTTANIEELLTPGESVIKKQSGVMFGGMPTGDLYLTNRRLIWLHKKRWGLLLPGALVGKDVQIPLQNISMVSKGRLGTLKIQADKEYSFSVSVWNTGGWVDAVQQVMRSSSQPSAYPPSYSQTPPYRHTPPPPPPPPTNAAGRFCPNCGHPAEFVQQYNRWYCRTCNRYL